MVSEKAAFGWVLQNPDDFWMLAERFKHDQFKSEPWCRLWPVLYKGWLTHERWPTPEELPQILNQLNLEAATKMVAEQLLRDAFRMEVSNYTKADVVNWLVLQEFQNIGSALLNAGDSKHTLQEQVEFHKLALEKVEGILGERTLGERFSPMDDPLNWASKIEESYGASPLPTGFMRMDRKLRDGGVRPTLVLIVGPTGGGKSTLLTVMSAYTVRQGGRWVQYVLDDNPGDMYERWYSHVLQRPVSWDDAKDPTKNLVVGNALKTRFEQDYPGRWEGIALEPDRYTPKDIIRHLTSLQHQFVLEDKKWMKDTGGYIAPEDLGKIDGVGVDTGDQIKPSRHYKDNWMEQEKLFGEMSFVPKKLKCPLFLTVQGGQESVGATQITVRNIGGSYGKAKPAKLILALAQTVAQSQQRQTLDPSAEHLRLNKEHLWCYNEQTDRNLEWEPAYICVIKNTMASGARGSGQVKNVMLPVLVDFSTCRIIEDYSRPEELMRADRKTLAEEQAVYGGGPPVTKGKRGPK